MTGPPAALAITRVVAAPPDAVFRAWTDPELARTWWSPRGYTTLSCDMDVRPGGAWKIRMRSPSGRVQSERGVFREVWAPERLVFSQVWDDPSGRPGVEALVTVTFAPHGERATQVRFEQGGSAAAPVYDPSASTRPPASPLHDADCQKATHEDSVRRDSGGVVGGHVARMGATCNGSREWGVCPARAHRS